LSLEELQPEAYSKSPVRAANAKHMRPVTGSAIPDARQSVHEAYNLAFAREGSGRNSTHLLTYLEESSRNHFSEPFTPHGPLELDARLELVQSREVPQVDGGRDGRRCGSGGGGFPGRGHERLALKHGDRWACPKIA
jgi:hypothetical protein